MHRLINAELCKRYTYLKLPDPVRKKIVKRVYIDINEYDAEQVQ